MRRRLVPALAAVPVALLTLVTFTTAAPAQDRPEGAAVEPSAATPSPPQAAPEKPPAPVPEKAAEKTAEKGAEKTAGKAPEGAPKKGDSAKPSTVQPPGAQPPSAQSKAEVDVVAENARSFFTELLAGNTRFLAMHSTYPFQLEERKVLDAESLVDEWNKSLRNKRTELLTLYGVEVYTPAEMEKKYGKPPERLANLPWKAPRTYIAVANLSGRAAIALFRETPGKGWTVVGYHD